MIRQKPLPTDVATRLSDLGRALESCPAVVFAYVFGGAAAGNLTPLSDVDVAVYVAETANAIDARLDIIGAVTSHFPHGCFGLALTPSPSMRRNRPCVD